MNSMTTDTCTECNCKFGAHYKVCSQWDGESKKHMHYKKIHAWAEGELIQYLNEDGVWEAILFPNWEFNKKFRVEPDINKDFMNIIDEMLFAFSKYTEGSCTYALVDSEIKNALKFFKDNTK
jgi:hypothetical protein